MSVEIWSVTIELGVDPTAQTDLTGFKVEALDGGIGKIDEATYDTGSSQIVVDSGPWILGTKVVLPAGVIQTVDPTPRQCSSTGPRTRSRTRRSSARTRHSARS
jgi:hypothetical protein